MTIPASDVIFTPTATGAVSRTVQDKLLDFINLKDFGAVGDGVADDTSALTAAAAAALAGNLGLSGVKGDTYLVSQTIDFSGLRFVDMLDSTIKQADGADLAIVLDCTTSVSGGVFVIHATVDANSTNNSASVTGIKFAGTQSANFQANLDVIDADIGVEITGNSEVGTYYIHVKGCTLGVWHRIDGSLSPDENLIFVSGRSCNTFFRGENTSGVIHFNCEAQDSATDYAVEIEPGRSTVLTGMIRNVDGGGIRINGGSTVLDMHMASIGTSGGTGCALLIESGSSVTGTFSAITCNENFVWVKAADTGSIDLRLFGRSIAGDGVILGDGASTVTQASIDAHLHTVTGAGLKINNATYCNINFRRFVSVAGGIDFAALNNQNTVFLPARAYTVPIALTHNANSQVIFVGPLSIAERDAIPNPFAGMVVTSNRQQGFTSNYFTGSAWVNDSPRFRRTHAGPPAGVVSAHYAGEELIDTTNSDLYVAFATGSGNWKKLTPQPSA